VTRLALSDLISIRSCAPWSRAPARRGPGSTPAAPRPNWPRSTPVSAREHPLSRRPISGPHGPGTADAKAAPLEPLLSLGRRVPPRLNGTRNDCCGLGMAQPFRQSPAVRVSGRAWRNLRSSGKASPLGDAGQGSFQQTQDRSCKDPDTVLAEDHGAVRQPTSGVNPPEEGSES